MTEIYHRNKIAPMPKRLVLPDDLYRDIYQLGRYAGSVRTEQAAARQHLADVLDSGDVYQLEDALRTVQREYMLNIDGEPIRGANAGRLALKDNPIARWAYRLSVQVGQWLTHEGRRAA